MIICITGTPGTGKTTIANKLGKKLKYPVLNVKQLIKDKKIYDHYDNKDKTFVVDTNKLNRYLIEEISKNKNLIIDSLLSHYLPKKYVDLCIITKCDLKILQKRLKKRKYSEKKIRDNLDAEIFDVCLHEAEETEHNIFVIYTTKGINKECLNQVTGEIDAIERAGNRTKQ